MSPSRSPSTPQFSTYPLPELLNLWERNKLTDEQMIGHLLQHLIELEQRVRQLEHSPARSAGGGALN